MDDVIERQSRDGAVRLDQAREALSEFAASRDFSGKRVLVIIPDNTRSGPVGELFKLLYEPLAESASAVDCLVALGTHQPMREAQICKRLSLSDDERRGPYARVKFFNHEWDKPETFTSLGSISAETIEHVSGGLVSEEVEVTVNRLIFDYDELVILGPVFPHEVVGFSGGHKYIFPGIAGAEIIDSFHWLGALVTNPVINGQVWTPTRRVVEAAASLIDLPRHLVALVARDDQLKGLFIGDPVEAWERAAALSEQVHIVYQDRTFHTVLGLAPQMYDDLWVAAKVMYKLEPVVADGGTLIIYAPHITEISHTHGKIIDRIGYHTRDYFLGQPGKFGDVPGGVKAHSTHVKGIGTYENGVEKPRVEVVLATSIPEERCKRVNLGYRSPSEINVADFENRGDEGILVVHHAGEILYRLRDGSVTKPADG